jgi:hypothetical protein
MVVASLSVLRRVGKGKPIFLQSNYHIRMTHFPRDGLAILTEFGEPF